MAVIPTWMTFDLERDMKCAGERRAFELVAKYRDDIKGLREWIVTLD